MEDLIIAAIGLATGFIGGFAGIGGAPFIIFLLTYFVGYGQHVAQGTVLAMMLGPMSLPAVWSSRDIVRERLREITICVITYAIASFLGGCIAYQFSPPMLGKMFGVVIAWIGLTYASTVLEKAFHRRYTSRALNSSNLILVGTGVGVIGGLFGIGSGILLVPIFTMFFGLEQREARIMSLAVLLPPVSIGAVIRYGALSHDVNWTAAGILLISYMLFNGMGARFGNRQHPRLLKQVLGVLLFVSGLMLFLR